MIDDSSEVPTLPPGWIIAVCEVCHGTWEVQQSLATRACSRKCGAKINPASVRDPSKWHKVTCETCGKFFERRKRQNPMHVFCSHACKSKGSHLWHNISGASIHKTGKYTSKSGKTFSYASSYELRRMKELDYVEKDVVSWERCEFTIPYVDVDGKNRNYLPDFFVVRSDGTSTIEETKGQMDDNDVKKMNAAILYAQERGWKYKIVQYDRAPHHIIPKLKSYTNDYGTFVRPTEETIFMSMALTLAERVTCLRKRVAAVFTDAKMHRVLCFGYNGNVAGGPNQCDALLEGNCGCTHAEINALTKSVSSLEGSTCFVTLSPCFACAKVLINRGVTRVVYYETYRNVSGLELLRKHGIIVEKYDNLFEISNDPQATLVSDLPHVEHSCECVQTAVEENR
jgi:dCMP deaminase